MMLQSLSARIHHLDRQHECATTTRTGWANLRRLGTTPMIYLAGLVQFWVGKGLFLLFERYAINRTDGASIYIISAIG